LEAGTEVRKLHFNARLAAFSWGLSVLEQVPNPQVVRFGTFEVDLRLGELRKNGVRLKLTGQPFQILVILLEHPGDLVTREQLQRRLWPSDTFVDFDRGLNAAINRVREALGDSAENPRFVETLPRRGYRFIAPLVDSRPARAPLPAAESNVSRAQTGTSPGALTVSQARERRPVSRRLKLLLGGVSILAVLAVVAVAVLLKPGRRRNEWDLQAMKLSRVTQSGNAVNVTISPDGHYVVYALREGEKQGLHVRQVATGSDVEILPPDEIQIYGLTFSPDANYIDFVRSEKNNPVNTFLYRIPTLGGSSHPVMQAGMDFSTSYSPDGAQFAFLRVRGGEQVDLLIANADGSKERVLATRPYLDAFTNGTAWSPDGKTIAFSTVESKESIRSILWAVSVGDGSVREIYSTPNQIGRPCWLPDGSGLLASIGSVLYQSLRGQLWFISFPKGQARRLTNDWTDYQPDSLGLTQDGKTLVDIAQTRVSDLWIAPAGDTTKAKPVTRNDHAVGGFSWTSDGRILFASGEGNLSILNSDRSARTPLTPNDHAIRNPSACGDGRYIVYTTYREQRVGIWRMDADGSNPTRIADEAVATSPQCSPDGKWVVYVQVPSLTPMRVRITGEKPPEAIANVPAAWGLDVLAFSPEGKRIAYVAAPETPVVNPSSPSGSQPNQLKVIAFDGGTLMHQFDWPASAWRPRWAPRPDAIDYILTRNGVSNIWQQNLAGGAPKQITNFESGQIFDFAWSHDGTQLAMTRGSENSDVILISNFR
jgi:Tol biopolymer transport system component/DNA-binding winged helix-turn-helix (wHTH) protein